MVSFATPSGRGPYGSVRLAVGTENADFESRLLLASSSSSGAAGWIVGLGPGALGPDAGGTAGTGVGPGGGAAVAWAAARATARLTLTSTGDLRPRTRLAYSAPRGRSRGGVARCDPRFVQSLRRGNEGR